ncbi:glycosyltransferase family 4 protein [candidate division KSB1 bacterium]
MKICFIGDSTSIHTKRWYYYFESKGHSVNIISWNNDPEYPQDKIHTLSTTLILNIKYFRAFYISLWVIRKIREISPDIIHIQMLSRYALGCFFIKDIPVIISIGGYDILRVSQISRIHFLLNKKMLERAEGITTSTQFIQRQLIDRFNIDADKIRCFCWGINYKLFSSVTLENSKIYKQKYNIPDNCAIIFHNRYFPAAKHQALLEAIKKLKDSLSEFALIIIKGISSDADWESVREYAKSAGIDDKIVFINKHISQNEMGEFLSFSDIYINILTHDQRGLSILEAMAAGCIPAVNNLPAYREFIKDGVNGIIFDSEEPVYIAERLYYVIQNLGKLKQKYKRYNQEYIAENDDREKNEHLMYKLYMDVMKKFK